MSLARAVDYELAQPNRCTTGRWLAQQTEAERAAFARWFDAGRPAEQMRQMCIAEGLSVGRSSFNEHVRSVCSCAREKPT